MNCWVQTELKRQPDWHEVMIQKEAFWSHDTDEKEIKSSCTLFSKMEKKEMLFFRWFLVLLPEFKARAGVEKPCWKCLWVGFNTTFTVFALFVLEPEGVMGIVVSGIKKENLPSGEKTILCSQLMLRMMVKWCHICRFLYVQKSRARPSVLGVRSRLTQVSSSGRCRVFNLCEPLTEA